MFLFDVFSENVSPSVRSRIMSPSTSKSPFKSLMLDYQSTTNILKSNLTLRFKMLKESKKDNTSRVKHLKIYFLLLAALYVEFFPPLTFFGVKLFKFMSVTGRLFFFFFFFPAFMCIKCTPGCRALLW